MAILHNTDSNVMFTFSSPSKLSAIRNIFAEVLKTDKEQTVENAERLHGLYEGLLANARIQLNNTAFAVMDIFPCKPSLDINVNDYVKATADVAVLQIAMLLVWEILNVLSVRYEQVTGNTLWEYLNTTRENFVFQSGRDCLFGEILEEIPAFLRQQMFLLIEGGSL